MIVDSSALLAVILGEADAARYAAAMVGSSVPRMSAANWFETAMVVDRRGDERAEALFETFVQRLKITLVPVTAELAHGARLAHRQFGGGNHPARLNIGDCFSYALAKATGEALLFKGRDFSQTDIMPALAT